MSLREISQLFYHIKLIDQKVAKIFETEVGFSLTRYEMMMMLKRAAPCSQIQIQTELKIDNAAITRHLKILEDKGYVVRNRNPENNRELFVTLTNQAKAELASCEEKHAHSTQLLSSDLSETEINQLNELLTKFDRSLSNFKK